MGACIFCGRPGRGEAHFISRAQGGLGIEENLLTVCRPCHDRLDNSTQRKEMLRVAEEYLRAKYPYWNKDMLIFEKGINTKERLSQIKEKYEKQCEREQKVLENAKKTKLPEGFFLLEDNND